MGLFTNGDLEKGNNYELDSKQKKIIPEMEFAELGKISHRTGETVGEFSHDLADTVRGYFSVSKKYVKDNPIVGVTVATATGVLIGSMMTALYCSKK